MFPNKYHLSTFPEWLEGMFKKNNNNKSPKAYKDCATRHLIRAALHKKAL